MKPSMPEGSKLNLGCGPVQPDGWINIDGSNRALLASKLNWLDKVFVSLGLIEETEFDKTIKFFNLSRGLPFPNNSVACIYAGELWEHFEYDMAYELTRESYRVLKPKGILRVCVPDGLEFWKNYLKIYREEKAKKRCERNAEKLKGHIQMFFNDICTKKVYLGSMGHFHKWLFDEIQLIEMFEQNGFSEVDRMHFHQSRIPDIDAVESSDYLIIEGIKRL